MWRVPPLEITEEDKAELERRARAHTSPVRVARRARIILFAAEGMPNRQVARKVGIKESYVSLWRRRFTSEGLSGLEDRPRPGRPPKRPRLESTRAGSASVEQEDIVALDSSSVDNVESMRQPAVGMF